MNEKSRSELDARIKQAKVENAKMRERINTTPGQENTIFGPQDKSSPTPEQCDVLYGPDSLEYEKLKKLNNGKLLVSPEEATRRVARLASMREKLSQIDAKDFFCRAEAGLARLSSSEYDWTLFRKSMDF